MRGVGGPLLCIGDLLCDVGEPDSEDHHDRIPLSPSSSSSRNPNFNPDSQPSDLTKLFQENYDELNKALAGTDHSWTSLTLKTTYENFRYRADCRRNIYNQGCMNNFLEVFCTKTRPSTNTFRSFVQEEAPRPATSRPMAGAVRESSEDRRVKVDDDHEIGNDILKISQRRDFDKVRGIKSRGSSNGAPHNSSDCDFDLASEIQARAEMRHSGWGRNGHGWVYECLIRAHCSATDSKWDTALLRARRSGGRSTYVRCMLPVELPLMMGLDSFIVVAPHQIFLSFNFEDKVFLMETTILRTRRYILKSNVVSPNGPPCSRPNSSNRPAFYRR